MMSHLKLLRPFRRGVPVLVAVLAPAPVAVVWDSLRAAPAGQSPPATTGSQANSSTKLFVVKLAGSSLTFRAKVTGAPGGAEAPTGSVTFALDGSSGPVQCDGLSDTMPMSGGVATCKVTSALTASGLPQTARATYSGDDNFTTSYGTLYASDGNFNSSTPPGGSEGGRAPLPSSPPVTWCETGLPTSPYTSAPSGAEIIPAGDDSSGIGQNFDVSPNTTYWFAPGNHTLGTDQYGQIQPQNGDVFIGAPGAVLDGKGVNDYAFTGTASGVTIEYLTVQNFVSSTDQIVVNHDGGANWLIEYDLLQNNKGGAVATGDGGTITNNCLSHNDQYGFQGWDNNIAITNNDIAFNNPNGYYDLPGSTVQCGCSGGGKFWGATNATVTGNYVHGNNGVGLWADTDNAGFLISGNYISNNWSEGIMYEISYNAEITNNTLIGNAIGMGSSQDTPGFPDGAIYISESGGDSRVASNYAGQFLISGNVLTDNWGGVVLWENADRYCSALDADCTLVDPAVYKLASCAANLSETSPVDYYDNCRWKTQNVSVENNTFNFNAATVGSSCTVANLCGFNGLFSDYGTSIYGSTRVGAITFRQNNHFTDNTYAGPWSFFAWSQSNLDNPLTWPQWTASVTDSCSTAGDIGSGTCNTGFGQDSGSSLTG